jgi:hypothetical protein
MVSNNFVGIPKFSLELTIGDRCTGTENTFFLSVESTGHETGRSSFYWTRNLYANCKAISLLDAKIRTAILRQLGLLLEC